MSNSFGEIDHSNLILQNLETLYTKREFFDIKIIIQNTEIPAHKIILASNSDYFRALLFGGLKESHSDIINLNCENLESFKTLLKYCYTGKISLKEFDNKEIIDLFSLSHQYGFKSLNEIIPKFLISNLNLNNACTFYDFANFYDLKNLADSCLHFMDKNAENLFKEKSFLKLSENNLINILSRDSFYASETDIFVSLSNWLKCNEVKDFKNLLKCVRTDLISLEDYFNIIRPLNVVSSSHLLDIIESKLKNKDKVLGRGFCLEEKNLTSDYFQTRMMYDDSNLFEEDEKFKEQELNRNKTSDEVLRGKNAFILIKFDYAYYINHIKMNLFSKNFQKENYSYYIEVSNNLKDWIRIIDYSNYVCTSMQNLYFDTQVVKYIRIYETSCGISSFQVSIFECMYTKTPLLNINGIISPNFNIATDKNFAQVIEGISRIKNYLINEDCTLQDFELNFTCHQIGNGSITIQLPQPYYIESMQFLLYNCGKRKYKYNVFTSCNQKDWIKIIDKTKEYSRSLQKLKFKPIVVVFIKIVGIFCSVNNSFHLADFKCPSI